MHRRSTRKSAPLICLTTFALAWLAGCGATSTQRLTASATGGTSTAAATTAPRGPQLGYVWDQTQKNLYPVLGVAGSAHYGAGLLGTDSKYITGAVGGSLTGSAGWALLLDSAGTLDLVTLPTITPTVVTTRVAQDAALSFAPGGGYALVFSKTANSLLLVSALPAQPQVSVIAAPAGSALAGAAVSDRGTVLAGWATASGVQVGTLSANGASAIANVSGWGGAGFVPGSAAAGQEQAVIADGVTGQVTRLRGVGGSAPTATQLSTGGKLQAPVAVAVSVDGLWAFAADGAKQQVVRLDLAATTAPVGIACACQPARLVGLPGSMVFEVSADHAGQPAWLLDGRAVAPKTFFVPALAATIPASTTASPATTASARVAAGGAR